jgi:hypothetical protein
MHACWQCKRFFQLFSAVERLTGAHAHFQVTRAAKGSACDGDGNAKANDKGKGKEKVADHATSFPLARSMSD